MSHPVLFAGDIVAALVLVLGLYFPRHHRRDLVVSYLGVNIGVLAVADSLGSTTAGAGLGLGLGLFGVLSIIRLRSTELDHHEVAYYFSALALGILGALGGDRTWQPLCLMAMIVVVLFLADHPRLFRGYRRQIVVLDVAVTDELALKARLEQLLGARVRAATVQRVDLVNDSTWVDVRFQPDRQPSGLAPAPRDPDGIRGVHR
jgi:hypothetical protein